MRRSYLVLLTLSLPVAWGQGLGNEPPANPFQTAGVRKFTVTKIRRFDGNLGKNQVAIRVDRSNLGIHPDDAGKFAAARGKLIDSVNFISVRCVHDVVVADEAVEGQILENLSALAPDLFADKEIKWLKTYQTGCQYDTMSLGWFRGFVITFGRGGLLADGTQSNFSNERLAYAQKHEYAEGDILPEIKKFTKLKLPQKFSPGHVTPARFNTKQVAIAGATVTITFPGARNLATPVICDGTLYTGGGFNSREFYAFDAETFNPKWAVGLSDNGPSTPACGSGVVAFNTESCTLFLVDGKTGKQRWSAFLGDPLISTPIIHRGQVITSYPFSTTGQASHAIAAFDAKTGAIVWQHAIDSEIISKPVIFGDTVFFSTFAGIVYGFRAGAPVIAHRLRGTSLPMFADSRIFMLRRGERSGQPMLEQLSAFDQNTRSLMFTSETQSAPYLDASVQLATKFASESAELDSGNGFVGGAPPMAHAEASFVHMGLKSVSNMQAFDGERVALVDDKVIVGFGDRISAFTKDGKKIWSVEPMKSAASEGGFGLSSPVLDGNSVFTATVSGKILKIAAADGKIEREFDVKEKIRARPLIHKSRLYIPTVSGKLVSIRM